MPTCTDTGAWDNHEQQYPHFFAWLKAHRQGSGNSRHSQKQHRPASRSASARTSQSRQSATLHSRPASASSHGSRPVRAASHSVPGSARHTNCMTPALVKEQQQMRRSSSLSTVPEHHKPGSPKSNLTCSATPASKPSRSALQQQQRVPDRPCSATVMSRLQHGCPSPKDSGGRPHSAIARPHSPAAWLADNFAEQQQRGPASAVPAWLQNLACQQQDQKANAAPEVECAATAASTRHNASRQSSAVPRVRANSAAAELASAAGSCSSSNPWAAFGRDAPAAWQQLEVPASPGSPVLIQHREWSLDLADSVAAVRPDRPQSPAAATSCSAPESGLWQQQQQQEQGCPRAARQMFLQLPLDGHASMNRQELQLLALGLQWALAEAGAPLSLQLPDYGAQGQEQLACWSAHGQVGRRSLPVCAWRPPLTGSLCCELVHALKCPGLCGQPQLKPTSCSRKHYQ